MTPRAVKLLSRTVIRAVCSKNTGQEGGMGYGLSTKKTPADWIPSLAHVLQTTVTQSGNLQVT